MSKETRLELHSMKLEPKLISQIEFFFVSYNKLYGQTFKVLATAGPKEARRLIQQGIAKQNKSSR